MQPAPQVPRHDPLRYTVPVPFEAEYYPMGFPFRIATNYKPVLEGAAALWSRYPKLFERAPLRVTIVVEDGPDRGLPRQEPTFRGQEHLLSIVADRSTFAHADLNAGFAHLAITREAAGDIAYLRYHFLEPLAYVLIAARHVAFVHAACVELEGHGVVLCGASGAGKTCLAYACARRGWTFVSGDALAVVDGVVDGSGDYRVTGRPFEIRFRHTAARLFAELARFPRVLRPSGKTDIEIDPQALNLSRAVESKASQLVVLERQANICSASADPISPKEARDVLEEAICFGDASLRERHGRALDRLVQLPAFCLRYSDVDAAERLLRAMVARER
jgi:hypothetical protein